MARIDYIDLAHLNDKPEIDMVAERDLSTRNSTLAIGHNPSVLRCYREYGNELRGSVGIKESERELIILTVGRTLNSTYIWQQHANEGISESCGVLEEEIRAISKLDFEEFDPRIAAMLRYVHRLALNEMDDSTYKSLEDWFDEAGVVDISMIAGFYSMVALVYNSLDLDTEEAFCGW